MEEFKNTSSQQGPEWEKHVLDLKEQELAALKSITTKEELADWYRKFMAGGKEGEDGTARTMDGRTIEQVDNKEFQVYLHTLISNREMDLRKAGRLRE